MGIKAAIIALFGKDQPRNAYGEREVKFYKEARTSKEHGRVVVSHLSMGLDQVEVPFVFPGMSEPPKLDDRLMTDIRSAAESQGYIFHHLIPHRYGKLVKTSDEANEALLDVVYELNVHGRLSEEAIKAVMAVLVHEADVAKIPLSGIDTVVPTGSHADVLKRMSDHLTSVTLPVREPRRAVVRTPRAAAINLAGQSVDDFSKEYVVKWMKSEPMVLESYNGMPYAEQTEVEGLLISRCYNGINSLDETADMTNAALVNVFNEFLLSNNWPLLPLPGGLAVLGGKVEFAAEVSTGEGQLKFARTNGDSTQH